MTGILNSAYPKQQQGVVLAITLIMLVMVTLLAVSSMRTTIMEERMAGNTQDGNIAFQMAETALRQAESNLQKDDDAILILSGEAATVGLGPCEVALDSILDWDAEGAVSPCDYVGTADDDGVSRPPHYYVEFMFAPSATTLGEPEIRDCFYRVTARGYGRSSTNYATLQTTYKFSTCS
ncbi:MAG: PilX N-terminal domain-containing pilus assembly protein [Gammaproteobacteria bacterium]|nr:PilX N-terminal domain-containing pilus assembly protein [Gammaproteobacteria bacterium]